MCFKHFDESLLKTYKGLNKLIYNLMYESNQEKQIGQEARMLDSTIV